MHNTRRKRRLILLGLSLTLNIMLLAIYINTNYISQTDIWKPDYLATIQNFPYADSIQDVEIDGLCLESWMLHPDAEYARGFSAESRLDDQGVIVYNYGDRYDQAGWQYTPYAVSHYGLLGMQAWCQNQDDLGLGIALAQADWLVENAVYLPKPDGSEDFVIWEYQFSNSSFNAEDFWTSGLGNGFAIVLLTQAYYVTQDERYREVAYSASQSFFVSTSDGGVRAEPPQGQGEWFVEVASRDGEPSYILNGHVLGVYGLAYYAYYFDDDEAMMLAKEGAQAIIDNVENFEVDYVQQIYNYSLNPQRTVDTHHYALPIHVLGLYYASIIHNDEDALFRALRWASAQKEPLTELTNPEYVINATRE